MLDIVVNQNEAIGQWAGRLLGFTWYPGKGQTIGFLQNGKIIAAVLIQDFNGTNCLMHVAAAPGSFWCKPAFLRFCFAYVFEQLGCSRVTGLVAETNVAARRLDEHLGFELETQLKGATPSGDLLVYVMWKDKCRWIRSNQDEFRQG